MSTDFSFKQSFDDKWKCCGQINFTNGDYGAKVADVTTGKSITSQKVRIDSKITILDGPPGNNDKVLRVSRGL